MQIHMIEKCQVFGDDTFVVQSCTNDQRLAAMGIDGRIQLKNSEIMRIEKTGKFGWVRMSPDDASTVQRCFATLTFTGTGIALGSLFPPWGPPVFGIACLKMGLRFGGIGRQVSVMIMSKDKQTMFIGTLPLWQVKKMHAIMVPEVKRKVGRVRQAFRSIGNTLRAAWTGLKSIFGT